MLDEITPEQFAEWEAFASLRPFGVLKQAEIKASFLAVECVDVEAEDVLRAWGFDVPIAESDVMTEEETEAWVCAAMGAR